MARKFGPRQLKREPSPGFWPIHRKEYTWAPRTRPGPHAREKSLPLMIIVRESLGLANIAKEAYKICKIVGKQNVPGGKLQYSLHDGRNLLATAKDMRPGNEELAVGGAVQLSFPAQKIVKYVPFQVGALGLVIDGRNQGYYGKITSITPGTYARRKIVRIETGAEGFETPADYVIPIGTDAPLVTLEK